MAREGEEATRVLYVAATRARDLLVVPALGDGRYDGWLQALTPVLYPPPARVHLPETRQPPGCPAFGVETTTGRPDNVPRPPDAVAPGLHVPEAGRHRVVWWIRRRSRSTCRSRSASRSRRSWPSTSAACARRRACARTRRGRRSGRGYGRSERRQACAW